MSRLLLLTCLLINACRSANILGVAMHPSFSHQVVFRPIWKHLSLRGHNVTVLTTDPMRNSSLTNLTEIDLSLAYDIWKESGIIEVSRKEGFAKFFIKSIGVGERIMRAQMETKEVKDLMEDGSRSFDLVIVEPVYTLGLGFQEKFKCPLVMVLSTEAVGDLQRLVGNPYHLVQYPTFLLHLDNPMSFMERLRSFVFYFVEYYLGILLKMRNDVLMKEYFGEEASVRTIWNRASLVFTNLNPAFGVIRPTVPAMIPLGGGFHLEDPKPLPPDLQTLLDNAAEGVVYFSLGSNVFSANLEEERMKVLKETFSELPFKVLWKFENETMDGKPANVHLFKWVPQWDLLRHPNVKVFITQVGLQSLEEALYANVPIVGMPQVADQFFNTRRAVNKGLGLQVDLRTVTKSELKATILEVASNPKYRERMKQLVDFANDQPMSNLERTIWWIEYVLRHNDTTHLRASDAQLPFYNYYNVDVIVTLLLILSTGVFSVVKLYSCLKSTLRLAKIKNK